MNGVKAQGVWAEAGPLTVFVSTMVGRGNDAVNIELDVDVVNSIFLLACDTIQMRLHHNTRITLVM